MRKISFIFALVAISITANAAGVRAPKHVDLLRLNSTTTTKQVPAKKMIQGTKTDYSSQIDYAQATWYQAGGNGYYTFLIQNYDTEIPTFQLDTKAKAKVSIEGLYTDTTNIDLAYSSVTLADEPVNIQQASMNLQYTGKDQDGNCKYQIAIEIITVDGDTCIFNGELPISAYEQNGEELDVIELKERYTVTTSAENGTVTGDGIYAYNAQVTLTATANEGYYFDKWSDDTKVNPYVFNITDDVTIEAMFTSTPTDLNRVSAKGNSAVKTMTNGQLHILRDGKTYNAQGGEL